MIDTELPPGWYKTGKAGQAREVNRELQQAYAQMSAETEFAARLQASYRPLFPEVGRVRFAVHCRSYGLVGSDCCAAVRLDERTVGFWLADAMSHGVPSALLAAFLNRVVSGKEIAESGYRIIPPAEVLARLNQDMLALQLSEPPMATMIYGTIDCISGEVALARAAHPQPIHVPADGQPTVWPLTGTLLGVPGAGFATQSRILNAGDRLVFVTDGLCHDPTASDQPELLEAMQLTDANSLADFAEMVATKLSDDRALTDDATVLALEFMRK